MPYDREIPIAVNRGVPLPMSAPRSSASKALEDIAHALLPLPASAKGKSKAPKGKGRKAELAAVEAPAPLAIGDGKPKRQSILTKLRKAA